MAEAVVTFFLERLSDLVSQEANLLGGVDEQVTLLQNKLQWMLLFLKDADVKCGEDERRKLWVKHIRDVTYDAEDVIDEFMLKIRQDHHRTSLRFLGSLTTCITCTHKLPVLHELANKIKEINNKIEEIDANKSKFGIGNIEVGESSTMNQASLVLRREKKAPIVEELSMVGVENSIREVKSLLMGGEPRRTVVSIVGMGGLGKTTLAKKVYGSDDVNRYFDCFAWVYVSQQFETKEPLQGILKCLTGKSNNDMENDQDYLREKVHEILHGRKYLIVLDDIWDTKGWCYLNNAFPDEENGSRVLITTRKQDVALHADLTKNLHELRFLNEVESWILFLKKIFPFERSINEATSFPPELKDLAKNMVAKCGGLPLAIVVLGGLLFSKEKTQIAWSKVNDSLSWHLSNQGTSSEYSCMGILALSYYNLPFYLKPCFLYMGIFPQDYEISSSKLAKYWIAEGFIQERGEETMEDIAEDYLEELISRSLVQLATRELDGKIKTCRIHDLLRDLSIREAKEDHFCEVYGSVDDFSKPNKTRRLTIHHDDQIPIKKETQFFSQLHNTRQVRSLLCFKTTIQKGTQFYKSLCKSLVFLRVLELKGLYTRIIIPEEIGELVHLKYLGLRRTGLEKIPNSLARLVNLQTLDLSRNTQLKTIPSYVIWSLTQLRHLYVYPYTRLISTNLGVDNLTNLQTLEISLGNWMEDGRLGKLLLLRELKIFQNGTLAPYCKKEISDSIAKLDGLRKLTLRYEEEILDLVPFFNHKVLYDLILKGRLLMLPDIDFFPPNLKKLFLAYTRLEVDPMEILEKLANLRFLQLGINSYVGKTLVCSEGGFPKLESLEIHGMLELEEWIVKEGALRSLKCLKITVCPRLKMLPDGLRNLSTIQELRLHYLPDELYERVEENVGDDWEKIRHIPNINIRGEQSYVQSNPSMIMIQVLFTFTLDLLCYRALWVWYCVWECRGLYMPGNGVFCWWEWGLWVYSFISYMSFVDIIHKHSCVWAIGTPKYTCKGFWIVKSNSA